MEEQLTTDNLNVEYDTCADATLHILHVPEKVTTLRKLVYEATDYKPLPADKEFEVMANITSALGRIDTSSYIKKKQGLSYLSWAKAWELTIANYPDATYDVLLFGKDNFPAMEVNDAGMFIVTAVTICGVMRFMYLPVMDVMNRPMRRTATSIIKKGKDGKEYEQVIEAVDAMNLNKSIMRCLVKNLAMFNLGINVYNGEDLPESVKEDNAKLQKLVNQIIKIGKLKMDTPEHKKLVQEILIKHAGDTNPATITDVDVANTIIMELEKIK